MISTDIPWGIVATVSEPAPLVMAFVAHHLMLGASEIHIHLDNPDDPVGDVLDWLPPVHVTRCTKDYWTKLVGWRPKQHVNRQTANATRARTACNVPFLLSCDADEFLAPSSDIWAQLNAMPDDQNWIKVFNLERAFIRDVPQRDILDGVFKVHMPAQPDTPLRTSDMAPIGFTGHAAGKPFVRTDIEFNIGIHVPRFGHIKERRVPTHFPARHIRLLHFDGLTPLHWAGKFLRQAAFTPERLHRLPDNRMAQCREILTKIEDRAALRALYDQVNGYSEDEVATLEASGHMVRETFDLPTALAAVFPGQDVDLSATAFDALLRPNIRKWLKMARRNGALDTLPQ